MSSLESMHMTQGAETSTKTHFFSSERVSCWREGGVLWLSAMWKCSRVFQALKVSPVYIKPLSLSLMRRLLHPHPWPLPYGVFLRFWEMRKTSLQILRCFSTAEHLWSQINSNREVHSCRLRWNQKTLTKLRLVRWEFNLLSSVSPIVFLMLFFFF